MHISKLQSCKRKLLKLTLGNEHVLELNLSNRSPRINFETDFIPFEDGLKWASCWNQFFKCIWKWARISSHSRWVFINKVHIVWFPHTQKIYIYNPIKFPVLSKSHTDSAKNVCLRPSNSNFRYVSTCQSSSQGESGYCAKTKYSNLEIRRR